MVHGKCSTRQVSVGVCVIRINFRFGYLFFLEPFPHAPSHQPRTQGRPTECRRLRLDNSAHPANK